MTVFPVTWLLIDERASHQSMISGVAEKLGWPAVTKSLRYNRFASLTNHIMGARLWHLAHDARAGIKPPWPDMVISAGRRAACVAAAIKKRSPKTKIVQIMWPDMAASRFDLIALPQHDAKPRQGQNIVYTLAPPHTISEAKLNMEAARWHNKVQKRPKPRIALLIGGVAKGAEFNEADFKELAAYAASEAERLGGSLLITSSPRTGVKGEELVKQMLTVPHFFHRWGANGDNPYAAFLGLADAVIVTGDSVSMCAEAAATGKPLYIFIPPHLATGKKGLREALFAMGTAKPHTYPIRLGWQPALLADAATEIADAIRTRLFASPAKTY